LHPLYRSTTDSTDTPVGADLVRDNARWQI
jgi:hypothetical protein